MKKERTQEFAARVTQASKSELIVIMYDVILEDIAEAEKMLSAREGQDAGLCRQELMHASRFINELMAVLDFRYRLSYELRRLYIYANKKLMEAAFSRKAESLKEARNIFLRLKDAFLEVAKQDDSGPMMQNTQKLTAGLTYGRGSLNEICIDPQDAGRGYLA